MKKMLTTLVFAATLSLTPLSAKDGYVNSDILISAEEAIKLIGKEGVMFVSGDSDDIYKLGHIKGSVEMYAHGLQSSDITGKMSCAPLYRCVDDAENYIGSKGIDNDTLVIAYDDFKGPNATGVYAFFHSYGHKKVKILNGGRNAIMEIDPAQIEYDAIREKMRDHRTAERAASKELKDDEAAISATKKAELQEIVKTEKAAQKALAAKLKVVEKDLLVVRGEEVLTPTTYKIDVDKIDLTFIAGKEEVRIAMEDILKNGKDSKYVIIDSRGMAEIIGDRKMDNVARAGHIPGSTFLEWSKISDLKNKMSFKSAEELKEVYEKFGITPDKTVYAYCMVGTGRGSEHIMALKLLGYENIKVFSGSWNVWGNDMNLPLKR